MNAIMPLLSPSVAAEALRAAAQNGHLSVVVALLHTANPKADDSRALYCAASRGHLPVVQVLIPLSEPMANGSQALRVAAARGHPSVVRALISVSDVDVAGEKLQAQQAWHAVDTLALEMVAKHPAKVQSWIDLHGKARLPKVAHRMEAERRAEQRHHPLMDQRPSRERMRP